MFGILFLVCYYFYMENLKELKKSFQKRNFYTTKDSGSVFLYSLLLPLILGFLFIYVFFMIISATGASFAPEANIAQELLDSYVWVGVVFAMLSQLVFLGIYFAYNKINRISQKSANFSFKKADVKTSLLSVFLGIFFVCCAILLIECCFGEFFKVIGVNGGGSSIPLDNVGWLFVNLLILGILPAVSEELLFRGVIFQGLKEKFSPTVSILLNGLIFALVHQNIQQFIYPFALGCVLALVMQRTNNLLYPILIHTFNNFSTIILSYLININVISLSFNITWWFVLIAIVLAGVGGLVFWLVDKYYLRKKKVEFEKEGELIQSPPISVGKFPLTMIFGAVISIILIVINAIG